MNFIASGIKFFNLYILVLANFFSLHMLKHSLLIILFPISLHFILDPLPKLIRQHNRTAKDHSTHNNKMQISRKIELIGTDLIVFAL